MLKITVATHKTSNETIPKDTVVEYDPYFITDRVKDGEGYKEQTSIKFKNRTWAKAADYEDGVTPQIQGVFKEYGDAYIYILSDAQVTEIKNQTGEFANVFNGIQNIIIAAIEDGWGNGKYTGVGEGNVVYYEPTF